MINSPPIRTLLDVVNDHLSRIYPNLDYGDIARQAIDIMRLSPQSEPCGLHLNKWSQRDAWLITYGDSVIEPNKIPLKTLKKFIDKYLSDSISGVHILPFFPYSSDEGFSVIDYSKVNDSLGDWQDIERIGKGYDLMADLVINHCSSRSRWFENFKQAKSPGKDYFFEASLDDDLSAVVRPRTSPLLKSVETLEGVKNVWCTFGHDQIDFNFANPDVFLEMVRIIRRYLEQGVRIFRLDAVAFLWKEVGSNCIHLPQTHEFVRLLRTLIEAHTSNAILITETNVPNHENLSYFGNANEAHAVYNFSLPPLLLHALVTGTSAALKQWQMSMPPAQTGTFYFNFIASHDGIGLRPAKGLLSEQDIGGLVKTMERAGALISWRAGQEEGKNEPYEINVSLYDALQGTDKGVDEWQNARFVCAHAIMFALEGIPGVYIHSFIATPNDYQRLEATKHNRNINRHKWDFERLVEQLDDPQSHHHLINMELTRLLKIRTKQPAFHPNAVQYTLHLGDDVFAFWRQSINRDQSIFCIYNVTDQPVIIPLSSVNLIGLELWSDLVSDENYSIEDEDIKLSPYDFIWLSNKRI